MRAIRILKATGLGLLVSFLPTVLTAQYFAPDTAAANASETLEARIEPARVSAWGQHEALLHVERFGRYAVTVESPRGATLQLIDRMAGPSQVVGAAGERDGRLDLFLERGSYKVIVTGPEPPVNLAEAPEVAAEQAMLDVHAFADLHAGTDDGSPQLVDVKLLTASLEDFQYRSWWLHVEEPRWVYLEAAGRHLEDLRLWRDGRWLLDAAPQTQVVTPLPGRPLSSQRIMAYLDAGLYLVSAYGGAGQPWAEDDGSRPLYVRAGVPELPEAGRRARQISPFGVDRFVAPRSANFWRLELPEATDASLNVWNFDPAAPQARTEAFSQSITKNSTPPVAELRLSPVDEGSSDALRMITIQGEAGQPYMLQHFELRDSYSFRGGGPYWLSTVHSGPIVDAVDATAIVARRVPRKGIDSLPFLARTIEVGAGRAWARRCNLLDTLTVHVQILESGRYEVLAEGVAARFRFEPFLVNRPKEYQPPPFRSGGEVWDLEAGYYVLSAEPQRKGILEFGVRPAGMVASLRDLLDASSTVPSGSTPTSTLKSVQGSARFGNVRLQDNHTYFLYPNQQPEVEAGLVLRPLPLDLTRALPLTQRPGERIEVPFETDEAGRLSATNEAGTALQVSVDGTTWTRQVDVTPGRYMAYVRDPGEQGLSVTQVYNLELTPARLLTETPLPPLPTDTLTSLPAFPGLRVGEPQFFNLGSKATRTFLVKADEPALYRVESSGLLATEGNLRSRVVTSLDRQLENGVGRNFLVQQYLRPGDYQLSVKTVGDSAGHLGLHLRQAPLVEGGMLADGVPARLRLAAGEAVLYRFHIPSSGRYRLRAQGLDRVFRARLEDADGWPIEPPNQAADWQRHFEAGDYRLLVLPEAVDNRVVTLLQAVPEAPEFEGHGPHELPIDVAVRHLWLEPVDGSNAGEAEPTSRTPDVWQFDVPADLTMQVTLTDEMTAQLEHRVDGQWRAHAIVPPERGWTGELEAGQYRLAVTCVRRNNRVPYTVRVSPMELTEGISREITAPAELPLVIGRAGLIELRSFGALDVRARLYDGERLIASHDDHPEDWNFQLAVPLDAGRYRLRVDPVGRQYASTRVSVERPTEHVTAAVDLPSSTQLELQQSVTIVPLRLARDASLLLAASSADQMLGMALEARSGSEGEQAWRTLDQGQGRTPRLAVALPAAGSEAYRLRLWSLDRRPGSVSLSVAAVDPRSSVESAGLTLAGVPGFDAAGLGARAGSLQLARAGSFRVTGQDVVACVEVHRPCVPVDGEVVVPASGERLHVVRWTGAANQRRAAEVQLQRLHLAAGAEAARVVRLPSGFDGRPSAPLVFDLDTQEGRTGPVVALARSVLGQPVVAFERMETAAVSVLGSPSGSTSSSPSSSTSSRPSQAGAAAAVWLTSSAPPVTAWAAGDELTDVRLHQLRYREVVYEPSFLGRLEGGLAGVAARGFLLPEGQKQLRLALGHELIAVLSQGDRVTSVHWAGGAPFETTVDSQADRLTLLHTAEGGHRYDIEVFPLARTSPRLTPETPFSEAFTRRGQREFELPATSGVLRLAGDVGGKPGNGSSAGTPLRQPLLIDHQGRVRTGVELPLQDVPARLVLPHGTGRVVAWIESSETNANAIHYGGWFPGGAPRAIEARPPAVVPLEGVAQRLVLELEQAGLVHVRSDQPGLTVTPTESSSDVRQRLDLHATGIAVDAYLPAGRHEIWLRALEGELDSPAELTVTQVSEISEGLGPEVMLPAGGSRAFTFTVPASIVDREDQQVTLGVGVRSESDRVEVRLLDTSGRRVDLGPRQPGQGVVLMPRLTAGVYLLELTLPADATPARARPSVVGLDRPSTGPPPDVLQQYLAEGETVSEGASR